MRMTTREERVTAEVLVGLVDVCDRLRDVAEERDAHRLSAALRHAVEDISAAVARLEAEVARGTGLSVEAAARYLGVAAPTVRAWTERGVLERKPSSKPLQIDRDSARRVQRALGELRARGQGRDWLAALVDYLHDTGDRRSESVRRGLEELARGELEPA